MNLSYLAIGVLFITLTGFFPFGEWQYIPNGLQELRVYQIQFTKGSKASGDAGEYHLKYQFERRYDKPLKSIEFDLKDTLRIVEYNYQRDLTKGNLTSKLEIRFNKDGKKITKDSIWTVYFHKKDNWRPYRSITILKNDTIDFSKYEYNKAGQITAVTSQGKKRINLKKELYVRDRFGLATKIQRFQFNNDLQLFEIEEEFKVDVDYSEKMKILALTIYHRAFGKGWTLQQEYNLNKNGMYKDGIFFYDKELEDDFYEFKFQQDKY